jgi:cellulose synthase/poly-beta-1,6-N-acetylglucosamine synthase-like glycosyltransferase
VLALDLGEPYEVTLVDDGSTDETAAIAESFGPAGRATCGLKVLRRPHRGAAAARNAGVQAGLGRIILFTDADCEPVPEWGQVLVAAIDGGADGAKGTYRTRQRGLVARFVQAEYESKYRHMRGRDQIDFIDTYSAAYRRDVLLEAGGFDETVSMVEDQELSFRLAEGGKRLVYVPEAVVYHKHVSSLVSYARRKFRIGYWKAYIGVMHPERLVSDSHTPQGMKLEMLFAGASLASCVIAPFAKPARGVAAACWLGFLALTLPFVARLWLYDPEVAAIAPLMLLLRALGLGWGLVVGTLRLAIGRKT